MQPHRPLQDLGGRDLQDRIGRRDRLPRSGRLRFGHYHQSITLDCAEGTDGGAGGILNSGAPGVAISAYLNHVTVTGTAIGVFIDQGGTAAIINSNLYSNVFGTKTTGTGSVVSFGNNRLGCGKLRPADLNRTPEVK